MTVGELISELECFNEEDEVVIGMLQQYGSNFAMNLVDVNSFNVTSFYGGNFNAVVLTEGNQIGVVDYD